MLNFIFQQLYNKNPMIFMHRTPYLKNDGLYRIDILAPLGSAWNV
jgi:hypothetical protein